MLGKDPPGGAVALLSLGMCLAMAVCVFNGGTIETFRSWLILPSLVYFISATLWAIEKEK